MQAQSNRSDFVLPQKAPRIFHQENYENVCSLGDSPFYEVLAAVGNTTNLTECPNHERMRPASTVTNDPLSSDKTGGRRSRLGRIFSTLIKGRQTDEGAVDDDQPNVPDILENDTGSLAEPVVGNNVHENQLLTTSSHSVEPDDPYQQLDLISEPRVGTYDLDSGDKDRFELFDGEIGDGIDQEEHNLGCAHRTPSSIKPAETSVASKLSHFLSASLPNHQVPSSNIGSGGYDGNVNTGSLGDDETNGKFNQEEHKLSDASAMASHDPVVQRTTSEVSDLSSDTNLDQAYEEAEEIASAWTESVTITTEEEAQILALNARMASKSPELSYMRSSMKSGEGIEGTTIIQDQEAEGDLRMLSTGIKPQDDLNDDIYISDDPENARKELYDYIRSTENDALGGEDQPETFIVDEVMQDHEDVSVSFTFLPELEEQDYLASNSDDREDRFSDQIDNMDDKVEEEIGKEVERQNHDLVKNSYPSEGSIDELRPSESHGSQNNKDLLSDVAASSIADSAEVPDSQVVDMGDQASNAKSVTEGVRPESEDPSDTFEANQNGSVLEDKEQAIEDKILEEAPGLIKLPKVASEDSDSERVPLDVDKPDSTEDQQLDSTDEEGIRTEVGDAGSILEPDVLSGNVVIADVMGEGSANSPKGVVIARNDTVGASLSAGTSDMDINPILDATKNVTGSHFVDVDQKMSSTGVMLGDTVFDEDPDEVGRPNSKGIRDLIATILVDAAFGGKAVGLPPTSEASEVEKVGVFETPSACTTFIDFDDDDSPCAFVKTSQISMKYSGLNVTFESTGESEGGMVLDQCGNFGVSGYSSPNFLAFNKAAGATGPESIIFSPVADFIQISVGSRYHRPASIECFLDGHSVGGASIVLSHTLAPLIFQGGAFDTCVLNADALFWVADDLCFNQYVQPGPEKGINGVGHSLEVDRLDEKDRHTLVETSYVSEANLESFEVDEARNLDASEKVLENEISKVVDMAVKEEHQEGIYDSAAMEENASIVIPLDNDATIEQVNSVSKSVAGRLAVGYVSIYRRHLAQALALKAMNAEEIDFNTLASEVVDNLVLSETQQIISNMFLGTLFFPYVSMHFHDASVNYSSSESLETRAVVDAGRNDTPETEARHDSVTCEEFVGISPDVSSKTSKAPPRIGRSFWKRVRAPLRRGKGAIPRQAGGERKVTCIVPNYCIPLWTIGA